MFKSGHFRAGLTVLIIVFLGLLPAGLVFGSGGEGDGAGGVITKGMMEIQWVSGLLFSSTLFNDGFVPSTSYWQNNLRWGWVLNNPGEKETFLRGNFEALLEVSHSVIYKGPGTYLAGITALMRYNFVPPGSRWLPYVQVGAGLVHTNAHKDHSQDAIGRATEFTPQASVGVRYVFRERWTVNVEGMFHHISNGGLSERNVGLNSFGGFVGVSYLFAGTGSPQ